ncbi:zinc transporter 2-like [Daphnia pulex]|uniref:zinc transporter 2-like n=1 Tax=Daphnia pulex TaxID=6669 RepID=UPI001EDD7887|nr:zinc transporter 2-like [Daphnia pulex]
MADSNLSGGLSIPGSAQRRKKAFSVSLRENDFDISEVPCLEEEIISLDNDRNLTPVADKCYSCGQTLPYKAPNERDVSQSRTPINNCSPKNHSLIKNSRTELQPHTTSHLDYESCTSSGENHLSLDHCHRARVLTTDSKAKKKLILASILCLVFMVGEAVGGYLANSLAIATDAAHLLTDFASFMISLFSLWLASRPPTKRMSFGWYRAEVIGALTSVLMIWVVTGILVYLAIQRLVNKDFDIEAKIMLITSGLGVVINLVMGCTLHQHGHSHGGSNHQHSHSAPIHDAENQPLLSHSHVGHTHDDVENINVRAAFIHVVGDFVQSLGVFIAAIIIFFQPDWAFIDPICTFLFSILVLFTTIAILKDALTVLMEGLPRGLDFNRVQHTFLSIDGVIRVHNLRIWALTMDKVALSAHLAIRRGSKTQEVLIQASQLVRSKFNVFEMTLQIEKFEAGMEDCVQCQDPVD